MTTKALKPLTAEQKKLIEYLHVAHLGKDEAIWQQDLVDTPVCQEAGITHTRNLQKFIKKIHFDYGETVCCHPDYGVYVATNREEMNLYIDSLKSRVEKTAKHAAKVRKIRDSKFPDESRPRLIEMEVS